MSGCIMIRGILFEGGLFFTILAENDYAYIVAEWIMCDEDTHPNLASLETSITSKIVKHDPRIVQIADDIFELV